MQMNITVIVCTFNRKDLLQTALESIVASEVPDGIRWEILVADNNSNDGGGSLAGVNLEAIAEFKIQTNAYDAEFGRSGGASLERRRAIVIFVLRARP